MYLLLSETREDKQCATKNQSFDDIDIILKLNVTFSAFKSHKAFVFIHLTGRLPFLVFEPLVGICASSVIVCIFIVSREYDKWLFLQILALVAGVLLEKQVVVVCPNLVS